MRVLLIIIVSLCLKGVYAQSTEKNNDQSVNVDDLQEKPTFPGGQNAMLAFLGNSIKYPHTAADNGIQGTVIMEFIVSKTGELTDIKVLRSIGGGCDEEAVRVVKLMPKWKPGRHEGKPVNVRYTLPVRFKLS
jgi:periplasmic protein TonB